jgi:hypothetical protein
MTQKKVKELTLELWRYLAEHPECRSKCQVPRRIYKKIWGFLADCPLCEFFNVTRDYCKKCPLCNAGESCRNSDSPWHWWFNSDFEDLAARKKAAEQIVEIVSAWEPEEE